MTSRIVLLHDADAATGRIDSSDTLLEAQALAAVVAQLGYEPTIVPVDLDLGRLQRTLGQLAPRVVINLVESLDGHGQLLHIVPALLEALGVAFTGCSASALGLTSHKLLAKKWLLGIGLPTPEIFTSGAAAGEWIVKSVWEHASLGIDDTSVVHDAAAVRALLQARRAELGGDWFAERFVPGRELNVAMIAGNDGVQVLPVAEIRFDGFPSGKPAIVGYAAKWHTDSFEYLNTPRSFDVEAALAAQVEAIARSCWELFGLDGYARVDFRIDGQGRPWVLEVNANPCLSPDAGFAAALDVAGIAYGTAVAWLLDAALRRAGREVGAPA
jgi:D-alanine-D-alanine ligase